MVDIYEEIARIRAEGEEAVLATVILSTGSAPGKEGNKILVKADGSTCGSIGGGELEARVCAKAVEIMKQDKSERLHFNLTGEEVDMICGGEVEIFIEPILPIPLLYIFGGGHVSIPLAKMGKFLGFKIVVVDDRPKFANPQRFPEADEIICEPFDNVFLKTAIGKSSYIVIVTRGHKYDELVLELALRTPAKYIGMMGSRIKNQTIFSHLLAKGVPQEMLKSVHSPIGLEIGAQTPEEIAVSILAEIIEARHL